MALSWDEGRGLFVGSPRSNLSCIIKAIILFFALLVCLSAVRTLRAQEPTRFEIAVDTAGIMPVGPNVYVTWIFARESPKHYPVSGIVVAFNCETRKVKRLYQVKYEMQKDSSITGVIQEVNQPWQDVTNPRMFTLVCEVGPTHPESYIEPEAPEDRPARPRNPYSDA